MKEVILTPEGYKKLKEEIEYLSNDKHREVAERIRIARQFGDIAENSEYDDAKNDQALLEHRIAVLEEKLANSRVITKKDIEKDVVSVGSHVKLRDVSARRPSSTTSSVQRRRTRPSTSSRTSRRSARRSWARRRARPSRCRRLAARP